MGTKEEKIWAELYNTHIQEILKDLGINVIFVNDLRSVDKKGNSWGINGNYNGSKKEINTKYITTTLVHEFAHACVDRLLNIDWSKFSSKDNEILAFATQNLFETGFCCYSVEDFEYIIYETMEEVKKYHNTYYKNYYGEDEWQRKLTSLELAGLLQRINKFILYGTQKHSGHGRKSKRRMKR